ncbi:Alpha/beta hydrolase fold-1 [Xylogone sp. PMI_703]|nr:Alpha/beta hydrolase fold-1 [Xylogone sp. PMI_703]
MTAEKPTIVFVPGAWHTPNAFDLVLPFLHAESYRTTSVHFPSAGVTPGHSDFSGDVAAIRTVVSGLVALGREVVIVAHSYGGTPTSEAVKGLGKEERQLQGLPGGITFLVYISAIIPKVGVHAVGSLITKSRPIKPETRDNGDGTSTVTNPKECFYHDIDEADAEFWSSLLQTQSIGTILSPLTYDGYRYIPSAYLLCAQDRAISVETQRELVADAGIKMTRTIDTGHSPFLSQPKEVAQFIQDVINNSV